MKGIDNLLASLSFTPPDFCWGEERPGMHHDLTEAENWEEIVTPGTVLRMKDGRVLLVGYTNVSGGYCDCCRVVYHREVEAVAHISQLVAAQGGRIDG